MLVVVALAGGGGGGGGGGLLSYLYSRTARSDAPNDLREL